LTAGGVNGSSPCRRWRAHGCRGWAWGWTTPGTPAPPNPRGGGACGPPVQRSKCKDRPGCRAVL